MKKSILSLALLACTTSFAQGNSLSTSVSKSENNQLKGLYLGLDYMNITDVKAEFKYKFGSF